MSWEQKMASGGVPSLKLTSSLPSWKMYGWKMMRFPFWENPPFSGKKSEMALSFFGRVFFSPHFLPSKNRFFQVWSCREMPRAGSRGGGRPRLRGLHVRCKQRLAALGAAHAAGLGATIPETLRDLGCRRVVGSWFEGETKKVNLNQLIVQGGLRKTSFKWGERSPLCWGEITWNNPSYPFFCRPFIGVHNSICKDRRGTPCRGCFSRL